MNLLIYFIDPILRGPTIGSMLMCLSAALIGVIVFLRKQSLIGETLSHAAYPGAIAGVITAGALSWNEDNETKLAIAIMTGAFLSALFGFWSVNFLEKKLNIRSDSALCFVLSAFFGIGLTLASEVQFSYTTLYLQAQTFLYGQAATMTDTHIYLYAILSIIIIVCILAVNKELLAITFNREFAESIGIKANKIEYAVILLTTLAVVIGIRSVGVVLMSAMLIAPAAAARQYTNKFHHLLLLASFFGLISAYLGNLFSFETSYYFAKNYPGLRLTLPTGPMIVIVASCICLLSLLFAPKRGFLFRLFRMSRFKYQCIRENILKTLWRFGSQENIPFEKIKSYQNVSYSYQRLILNGLIRQGYLKKVQQDVYSLTPQGYAKAGHIVRMHRLWEVYLANYLGVTSERVHRSAEEMEHIITPELERELTVLLNDPKRDPHNQIIPREE